MVEDTMKSKRTKKCYDLFCPQCGMSITVKSAKECPGSDVMFVCCGESMKIKK
jgi:RNase P subunit RPR2